MKKPDREWLLRAVRWARLPGQGHTVAQACAKFGLSQHAYRKAARELGYEARLASDDDILLAGLHPSGEVSVESLRSYYDWVNHAVISAAEVHAVMKRLIKEGLVKRAGQGYELTREWP